MKYRNSYKQCYTPEIYLNGKLTNWIREQRDKIKDEWQKTQAHKKIQVLKSKISDAPTIVKVAAGIAAPGLIPALTPAIAPIVAAAQPIVSTGLTTALAVAPDTGMVVATKKIIDKKKEEKKEKEAAKKLASIVTYDTIISEAQKAYKKATGKDTGMSDTFLFSYVNSRYPSHLNDFKKEHYSKKGININDNNFDYKKLLWFTPLLAVPFIFS